MRKISYLVIPFTLLLVSTGCAVHVNANDNSPKKDVESVFGGITVDKNVLVRDVSSVNGGIDIESGSIARNVDAVNGGIDVGNNVTVESVETVNGSIDTGSNLKVNKNVSTVNGSINIGMGSQIGLDVKTVNGDITLNQASISRNVKTNNGDVRILKGTVINGNLIVEKSDSWFSGWFSSDSNSKVIIEIDETSEVKGTIHLYKQVTLKISDNARVGEIKKHYRLK